MTTSNPAATPQPEPTEPTGTPVVAAVIQDLEARREFGREKYGFELHSHNGRDPMEDAYQEFLDLIIYFRQALLERDSPGSSTDERRCSKPLDAGSSPVQGAEDDQWLFNLLCLIYDQNQGASVAVAMVCDTYLDRSGALLGKIREAVAKYP